MRRTAYLFLVVALLAFPLSSQAADSSPVELTVLTAPKEVPAFSSFYVRLRLVNTGSRPLRGCLIELSRLVSTEPCVFLGYRFWKAPTRFKVDSVDPLPFLQHSDILGPGEQIERSAWSAHAKVAPAPCTSTPSAAVLTRSRGCTSPSPSPSAPPPSRSADGRSSP